jgi:acetylglutamate kinase
MLTYADVCWAAAASLVCRMLSDLATAAAGTLSAPALLVYYSVHLLYWYKSRQRYKSTDAADAETLTDAQASKFEAAACLRMIVSAAISDPLQVA